MNLFTADPTGAPLTPEIKALPKIEQSQSAVIPIETEPQANRRSVPGRAIPVTASSSKSERIPALDFTKGALVLLMVLYHWVNYFIGNQWGYYRYLRFLTPSFIFIAGFMISNVYLSKYAAADARLFKRLFTRGLKLMAIFLALNVARSLLVPALGTGEAIQNLASVRNVLTIFVSGNLPVVGSKLVSFWILVPISYVLMLSGVLMLPYRFYKGTFHVTCGLILLSILVLGLMGGQSYNLEFIAIGMLGVLSGFMPVGKVNDFGRHPYAIAFAYTCYVVAITIWNVPLPLLIAGVLLNLMVLYVAGTNARESSTLVGEVILLGKYSLLGYISQVAILQVLSVVFRHTDRSFLVLPISLLAAFILTIMGVEVVDRARAVSAGVDRLYRVVFA